MQNDPWRRCKMVSGREPSKKSSWCAALHESNNGSLWCGMEITNSYCRWRRNADTNQAEDSAKSLDQR